jgi:hypothetical protein
LLSNYNIKYICTIYTRLDTCLMSISRFSLRNKVTLRSLKLHFYGADVVEWHRALDIRLSDWCRSVSMVWVQIPSREEQNLTGQKSNSNTVWFNFQTYIFSWNPREYNIYMWITINNSNRIPQYKSVSWLLSAQTTAKYTVNINQGRSTTIWRESREELRHRKQP